MYYVHFLSHLCSTAGYNFRIIWEHLVFAATKSTGEVQRHKRLILSERTAQVSRSIGKTELCLMTDWSLQFTLDKLLDLSTP